MATLYSPTEIAAIARAGSLCAAILTEAAESARGGAAGAALDSLVRRRLAEAGADAVLTELSGPASAFPGAISISTGPTIANGQPTAATLAPGAIVRLDLALRLDGWIADAATTVVVEPAAAEARRIIAAARAVTDAAIAAIHPGVGWARVLEAGWGAAAAAGVHIADWPWGHGVGRRLHEPPVLPSDPAAPGADFTLRRGMVLAIEPIVLSAPASLAAAPDGWSIIATAPLAPHAPHAPPGAQPPLAACEERTAAVGESAAEVLTPLG